MESDVAPPYRNLILREWSCSYICVCVCVYVDNNCVCEKENGKVGTENGENGEGGFVLKYWSGWRGSFKERRKKVVEGFD